MKKKIKFKDVNTSSLIHEFIVNLCKNSNPEIGLTFSSEHYDMMNKIKKFNYQKIYSNPRFKPFMKYATLVINAIFDFLGLRKRVFYCICISRYARPIYLV